MNWDHLTGYWLGDREDREMLALTASPFPDLGLFSAPEEIDITKIFPDHPWIENQASQGSCAGHANSTITEWCLGVATQDTPIQLSREMAYIAAQQIDGIRGDQGSTISAHVQLSTTKGLCEESLWPYPNRYNPNPPVPWEQIWENAKQNRVGKHSVMRSYDDVFRWNAAGIGGVDIGIRWNVPDAPVIESLNRGGGGGHSVALIGYSKRVDRDGRKYLWLYNSWGKQWGNGGRSEVAPRVIEQMLNDSYTVMIGMSDMVDAKPRKVDFTKLGTK